MKCAAPKATPRSVWRPVVFATDPSYVRPTCVAIRSVGHVLGDRARDAKVIVLHVALDSGAARQIEHHAHDVGLDVELRCTAPVNGGLPIWGWVTRGTYLRLMLARALTEYDSALYLDGDTLCVSDIQPLLELELGEAPLAAVRDVLNPVLRCNFALPGWEKLGLPGTREYFNAGVLVVNLRVCRQHDILERALWFVENRPEHILMFDQDALNWVVDDHWLRLPRCWNALPMSAMLQMFGTPPFAREMLPVDTLLEDERAARIVHYAGPRKPWKPGYAPGAARERYERALAELNAHAPPSRIEQDGMQVS